MAMATATTAALMLAPSIASAATSIFSGFSQSKEANYNAGLYTQQAGIIDTQKAIEAMQYERAKRQIAGTTIARTAKGGLMMSGSPMAVMVDNLTQLEMDKQVGQYNFEVQKRYALSGAEAYKRRASIYERQGYINAFSTLLKGGFDAAMAGGVFSPRNTIADPVGRYNVGYGAGSYPGGYSRMSGLRR